jgi:EmrB/QacA subfamily drug resistance transporter
MRCYSLCVNTERSLNVLLALVSIGFFMQTLDSTIINTALPSMAHGFNESPLRMQSVIVAYALTMAVLIPASGWLADRFGTRRTYFGAISVFIIGSVCCALSRNLNQLVACRVLQGMGGAMLLPVGRLALIRAFPPQKFLQAMSMVAIPGLVGPLIGPTLGGWLVQVASWHWVFLINVPVGLIGLAATLRFMPEGRMRSIARFDLGGYVLIAAGMVFISIALDGLSELGLRHVMVMLLLLLGLASLAAYWLRAAQHPHPLFSPTLFGVRTFGIGLIGNLFARIGSGGMPFLIPLLLQVNLGHTPFEAGLMMLPVAAAAIATKSIVTRVISRAGYRRVLVINTFLLGLAMASFAFISPAEPVWVRILQLAAFGMLNSIQFTAMNAIVLKDLDRGAASSGNSLLSMVQMLAMSMGVAVAGALLNTFTNLFAHGQATHALPAFHATFVCIGVVTCISATIFWQLAPEIKATETREEPVEVG